jgi:predicted DNA-binding protein (MmcQ/YjbR family)
MTAPNDLLQELTRNSYEIVKAKYAKVNRRRMDSLK